MWWGESTEYEPCFVTWLIEMLTIFPYVEIGRSVMVQLARIRLSRYIVDMYTFSIFSARHSTTDRSWYVWDFGRHSSTQGRRIQCTQSCSIQRSCLQFYCVTTSCVSRQRHCHQQNMQDQEVCWRHFCFVWQRQKRIAYMKLLFYCKMDEVFLCAISLSNWSRMCWKLDVWLHSNSDNNMCCHGR